MPTTRFYAAMPPASGQEEALKKMMKIVNSLLARQDSTPFREPVDWRGLELYDYPEVIETMMDLGTVKRKLERGNYKTAHEAAQDIRLIWSNCQTYNQEGSDFWLLAKSYSRRFEDRYRKVRQECDVGEDLDDYETPPSVAPEKPAKSNKRSRSMSAIQEKEPSSSSASDQAATASGGNAGAAPSVAPVLDARVDLGTKLFMLSGREMGHVMSMLETECPKALETWDRSKVEIDIDAIPPGVFSSLKAFVDGKVGTRGEDPPTTTGRRGKKRRSV